MISLRCPHDRVALQAVRKGPLRFYRCESCQGVAVNLAALRKLSSPEAARGLWRAALDVGRCEGPACPSCERPCTVVPPTAERPELDLCRSCQVVWFDAGELEQSAGAAPEPPPASKELPPEGAELLARLKSEQIADDAHREGPPADPLRAGLAMWGVPFEEGVPERRVTPVLTWGLSGLSVLVFLLSLPRLDEVAGLAGFVPEEASRGLGLPLLTGALVHEDPLHLALDLLLLLVFADNVEDELGLGWFLALVASASVVGGLTHAWLDPFPEFALVGSTAVGTAAFVYYALRFPRARLGAAMDLRRGWDHWRWGRGWMDHGGYEWVRVPCMLGLALYLVMILLLAGAQLDGEGWISGVSALGGAATGLGFWLLRGARRW
ncbi:MAG: rhomboid family intramembrane serine protease [Alphaproteobacteria bacterium]|nr:rhomboid family intramembrane serine protease [Alphaproteobacteria bacterium]MCB9791755.1 rhomboid family intramembrane serine protease [Alphaproteobacteria bacterium]